MNNELIIEGATYISDTLTTLNLNIPEVSSEVSVLGNLIIDGSLDIKGKITIKGENEQNTYGMGGQYGWCSSIEENISETIEVKSLKSVDYFLLTSVYNRLFNKRIDMIDDNKVNEMEKELNYPFIMSQKDFLKLKRFGNSSINTTILKHSVDKKFREYAKMGIYCLTYKCIKLDLNMAEELKVYIWRFLYPDYIHIIPK